ncbi:hypothetical protein H9X57_04375 [Flavobacterium piscinae]|uniref:hypothetical protein n=1 Tax=Flavobacterium piscinae TaxID=2506424 RepID=UPI0019B94A11|nr:hypothetical protein [Flavobacterium piscinae]MBC8882884.1 hypothetical protein [Flavobacterium piscinae]
MWQFDNVSISQFAFFVLEAVVNIQLGLNGTRIPEVSGRMEKICTDFLIRLAKADNPEVSGGFVCAIVFFF